MTVLLLVVVCPLTCEFSWQTFRYKAWYQYQFEEEMTLMFSLTSKRLIITSSTTAPSLYYCKTRDYFKFMTVCELKYYTVAFIWIRVTFVRTLLTYPSLWLPFVLRIVFHLMKLSQIEY